MIDVRRPSPATLVAVLALALLLGVSTVREFVWKDLRAGMLDVRSLSRPTRALVWLGNGYTVKVP